MYAWDQQRTEEGIGSPKHGSICSCEHPCGFWELNESGSYTSPANAVRSA